jgi:hypothetical protein
MEAGNVAREKTDPGPAASDVIGAEVSGGTLADQLSRGLRPGGAHGEALS